MNLQSDQPYCRYGCCELNLPDNLPFVNFTGGGLFRLPNYDGGRFCGFSNIMDPSTFTIVDNETNLFWRRGKQPYYGIRLNWGFGEKDCAMAKETTDYSCASNAECLDSPSGKGHVCKCLPGYEGNGYSNGTDCTDIKDPNDNDDESSDINECNTNRSMCVGVEQGGLCFNLVGSYNCSCTNGYVGDDFTNGTGCKSRLVVCGCLSSSVSFGLESKETPLKTCGGQVLSAVAATHSTLVAIKKSKQALNLEDDHELLNEVTILSQINHRNIVKLFGCCIQTKFPLLVSEFVPNGTLFQHLHSKEGSLPWASRLQIAIETGEALAYLHSGASQPIFHRDVKSSNILLNEKLSPKVADFGISRLISASNNTHVTTYNIKGTWGYLDPDYFQVPNISTHRKK
ncbi:hypothetical protein SUGI_0466360 [Cryptomeria japonica]|nr:hypothetical protein SUGI_0466360 [Cryptomeria japonica]